MIPEKTTRARFGALATLVSALALIAGATVADAQSRDKDRKRDKDKDEAAEAPAFAATPAGETVFASTYKPYPNIATAIRGATVYDGKGGVIQNGVVFMSGGKIVSVGGPETPIPADIAVFDGTGKFVTPGIIDIHSHLGDYPSPEVEANSDGNEATSPTTPEVWAEHSV